MVLDVAGVIDDMPERACMRNRPGRLGFGVSFGLHILVGLALLLVAVPRLQTLPSQDSVSVDVLTPQQFDAAYHPAVDEARSAPSTIAPSVLSTEKKIPEFTKALPEARPRAEIGGMIRVTRFRSAAVLADPRSAKALKALRGLDPSERIIQLCNIEAMEQVHLWKADLLPDFLVAYAMADTKLSGHKLAAEGGALRSKRHWYNISFTCEVAPDMKEVVSFAFLMGDEIPESRWEEHNLPVDDGPSD